MNQNEIDAAASQAFSDAHAAARKRLDECAIVFYQDQSDGEVDADTTAGENLSAAFCGCDACVVREVIHAAHDDLEKYFLARIEKRLGFSINMVGDN